MFQKALMGLWATCVCVTLSATGAVAAETDIVMYATDASNVRGNWSRIADTTAAGGQTLSSADRAWANTGGPLASPADSFDVTFTAPTATAYHVWLRMRATPNSKYNDSVFAQFSDAVDGGGAAVFGLGTTTGLTVNLAGDVTGNGLSGWGWQDGSYWLSQPTTIRFATSGSHTLRIQTREDGASIDQIVLSPMTFLTAAPGPMRNDATIVPKPTATLPAPWVTRSIGAGLSGSAGYANGVFSVAGSGADIWGAADGFQFVSQPSSGDTQIVARISSIQNTHWYAKAGVMLRETADVGSAHVILDVLPNGSIEFMSRPASGAATTYLAGATQAAPAWLKLARSGATVTGSVSSNGTTWTVVGSTSVTMAGGASMGLAVTSHDPALLNTATFDAVTITVPPAAPGSPAPDNNLGAVATTAELTWTAAGATRHDISFGTTNPPPLVSSGLANASYFPAGMMAGTTYYWRVIARNAAGSTPGPIWSFTTIAPPPATPASPVPASGATSVSLNPSLTWNAPGAAAYDVSFGASNPPSPVATGLTSAAFAPATLTNGTTYFWQVSARNAGGTSAGPVWSFTAVAAPSASTPYTGTAAAIPGMIQAENFDNGAEGVAYHDTTTGNAGNAWRETTDVDIEPSSAGGYNVGWMAPGEWLNYTVNVAAAGTYTAQFQVASNGQGGTFHLEMNGTNVTGALTIPNTGSWQSWQTVSSTVTLAAGTQTARLVMDTGSPVGNIDWMQLTATAAPPPPGGGAGAPAAPNTPGPRDGTAGVTVTPNLSWKASGASSYDVRLGTSNPPSLVRSNSADYWYGPPALASGTTYFWQIVAKNSAGSTTGPVWSFTTAGSSPPPPPPATTGAPTSYNAITDRTPRVKPAVPVLGSAGFTFNDPTFGSKILRVTDGNTRPGLINRSFRVPANSHLAAWNTASTAFYVLSNDGTSIPYSFNPTTMTASRIQPSSAENGGLTLAFYVEPQFSLVNPNVMFGAGGANNRTISQYDFSSGSYTTVIDLDTIISGLAGTYVGGVSSGGIPSENLLMLLGGGWQDRHFYALWAPVGNLAGRKLVNTVASTINGVSTNTVLNFHLHSTSIDKSGRFVNLYPTGVDLGAPRYASQVYVWDTLSDTIVAITSGGNDGGTQMRPGGHDAGGFGYWVNQDCCTSSSWDAAQWQFRDLTNVSRTNDLISPILSPKEIYLADHSSWNNAQPDALVPFISSTYRFGNNTAPWRAWDDEILAIDTTDGIGGIVWRFAHHRSLVASDTDPTNTYFWYQPIANVSPDGRWALFTSNWEKTLGRDSSEPTFRQDVFLVALTPQP